MAVMPGKTNRGLVWLILFLVVSSVCLRSCHARRCSPKGCIVHFGKRIAPFMAEDDEPAAETQNDQERNLQIYRLVKKLLSDRMTSQNSALVDETK